VEWSYNEVKGYWKALGLKGNLQMWASKHGVGTLFRLCAFLSNCRACLNGGNQISTYFGAGTPPLDWYVRRV
jgi:hypothetical protein